jgi:hypothetical protein
MINTIQFDCEIDDYGKDPEQIAIECLEFIAKQLKNDKLRTKTKYFTKPGSFTPCYRHIVISD